MADKSLSTLFLTLSISETQRLADTTHQRQFRCCSVENRKVAEVEVLERSNAASNLQILKSGNSSVKQRASQSSNKFRRVVSQPMATCLLARMTSRQRLQAKPQTRAGSLVVEVCTYTALVFQQWVR